MQKNMTCIYIIIIIKIIYLIYLKKHFAALQCNFKYQRQLHHYIYILFFFVENEQNMVVFSILIQYFRYFSSSFILGLSPTHLHLYKTYFKIKITWLIGFSGFKGLTIPNIILGAFIYCMLRPQFFKPFTNQKKF
jgi:hypothetical protein